jgi:TetR/AcrR family transcriptional repressor of nem operon
MVNIALIMFNVNPPPGAGSQDWLAYSEEPSMKVSRNKLAENRTAMIQAAGRLFRERGIEGAGVAEICKEAGLTHGALYAQFGSKSGLAMEALEDGLRASDARMLKRGEGAADPLSAYVAYYLSPRHRNDLAGGCSIAALAADVARQDAPIGERFAAGFTRSANAISAWLPQIPSEERSARAIAILSLISGAITASRAAAKADPDLADRILNAARDAVERLVA